jgi:flagellar hook-length control protein FliK
MTMMMNTVSQSASAAAKNKDAAQPAQAAPEAAGAPRPDATASGAGPQPFAAWLGEQSRAAALAAQARTPASGDAQDAAQAGDDAPAAADGGDGTAALPQDGALLAAMAMPLMPLTPVQVAQAVQAAQPSTAQAGAQSGDTEETLAVAGIEGDARRGATTERGFALPQAADTASGPAARPAAAQADAAVARFAVHAQPDTGGAGSSSQDSSADHAGNGNGNGNGPQAAAIAGAAAAQPAANAPASDTVKLAGPPTAWRQSLQEALGERMHLQVGKGIEQAVIRLEPPQLGRIDIAIRHSAGALEVNISATNSEVLRQLQTVSDNLRSDLSQRQFTEVAVTVAPAPKNNAAPFGDPQQGRGRQQGREHEDKQPGRALAEANDNPSGFSLA